MTRRRLCVMVTSSLTATTFLHGYLQYLQGDGWEVTLVCSEGPGIAELVEREGIDFAALSMEREPSPFKDLRAVLNAQRILRRLHPDVLVYATPKASLVGALAGWLARVPRRVYELWGLRLETSSGMSRRLFWLLESLTMRLSSTVVANSRSLAARVEQLGLNGRRPVEVLGAGSSHGVDADRFSRDAEMPPMDAGLRDALSQDGSPVIGFVGRLHPDKGIDTLFDALKICADQGLAAQLLVVGGDEGVQLPNEIRGDASTIPVRSAGFVTDVRPMLKAMDVLVLPSRREGFPNVVLEAAAMEVPAIVSDATGCVDSVVDGVTGVVVPVGDDARLAKALTETLADETIIGTMGQAARVRATADYSPESVWALHAASWAAVPKSDDGSVRR